MTRPLSSDNRDPRRFWLHPMLREVRRTDTEIRMLLEKAAQAAEADVARNVSGQAGQSIRRVQFASSRAAIHKTLRLLFEDVGDTVRAGRLDSARAALLGMFRWEDVRFRAAGISDAVRSQLRAQTQAIGNRNVELMLRRFNTEQIPLSRQVYRTQQLASKWVDNLINLGIGRGLTARELAREVRDSIRPDVRGGVAYASMRLARTELNNAFHAAAVVSVEDKPWVLSQQWNISVSHPKEDICDKLAKEDRYGMGSGVFPKSLVPKKPHPQCFCFIVPKLQDEDDFVADFVSGVYDARLDSMISGTI